MPVSFFFFRPFPLEQNPLISCPGGEWVGDLSLPLRGLRADWGGEGSGGSSTFGMTFTYFLLSSGTPALPSGFLVDLKTNRSQQWDKASTIK